MIISDINILAVVLAIIANMIVGMVWYHPKVFGAKWAKLSGINIGQMQKCGKTQTAMIGGVLSGLLLAVFLSIFIGSLGAASLVQAVLIGVLLWVGFSGSITLLDVFYGGNPKELWILNSGYQLVTIIIMSGLIYLIN